MLGLTKKPRTPKIKRANKLCELGHSALKTVEQTKFAPEEVRCVECIKTRRGERYCRRRYDVRTRKQIETTDVYAGKGVVGAHLTVNLIYEVHDFVNVWSQWEVEHGKTNKWRHEYRVPCPRTSRLTPNDLLHLKV